MRNARPGGPGRLCVPALAAVGVIAALSLGCAGLDPSVYHTSGQRRTVRAKPAAPKPVVPKAPSPPFRSRPTGRWSDDGLWYREGAATTGVPGIPFPLSRTRLGEPSLRLEIPRDR